MLPRDDQGGIWREVRKQRGGARPVSTSSEGNREGRPQEVVVRRDVGREGFDERIDAGDLTRVFDPLVGVPERHLGSVGHPPGQVEGGLTLGFVGRLPSVPLLPIEGRPQS